MDKSIRLFLVDDHQMFLEGIFSILEDITHFVIAGTAKNGADALTRIPSLNIDLVITDIEMPEMDGLSLARQLKQKSPATKILIASSHAESSMVQKAIKSEVNGYLLKNTGKLELLKAIHTIFEGNNYFSEEVKNIITESMFSAKKTTESAVKLSPREKDVLSLITKEKNTSEIAKELCISVNTVETHRKNLMRKIGTKNVVGLVKYAIQQGME